MKKTEDDDQELEERLKNFINQKIRATKEIQGTNLVSDTPNYLKLLSKFLIILKSDGMPVILKKEINDESFACHDFEETNIKSICYAYATSSFRNLYTFVKPLEELCELKTKVFFDNYLIKVHNAQNEWWLCKKKTDKFLLERL